MVGDHVVSAANGNGIRVHPTESGKGGKTIYTNMITTTNIFVILSLTIRQGTETRREPKLQHM